MLSLLIVGINLISNSLLKTQSVQKIQVGVVIPQEEKESRFIVKFVGTVDSIKNVCDFQYMDEETALKQLESGELQVVIVIPDNFYEDVYVGKNTPATIYFPENSIYDLSMFQEMYRNGLSWLQVAEAGVYATLHTATFHKVQVEMDSVGDYIAQKYISEVLQRNEIYEQHLISPLGGWDLHQYSIIAVITLFLLMSGLNYGFLYENQNRAVEEKLRVYGVGKLQNAFVKITVMTTILWILANMIYIALCIWSEVMEKGWIWYDVSSSVAMLVFCFSMAVYFHIVYCVTGSGYQGTLVLLVFNVVMIIGSGTIFPREYLPEIIGKVGKYFPLNYWSQYCGSALFRVVNQEEIIAILIITGCCMGIGVLISWTDTWFGTNCS